MDHSPVALLSKSQRGRCLIHVGREGRRNNLGWYRYGRDGLALKYRINLNSLYVDRSQALRIAVLAHEMAHLWEDVVHGHRRGSYHSSRFRAKVEEIGIPTTATGHYAGITPGSRFAKLLGQNGVVIDLPDDPQVTDSTTPTATKAPPGRPGSVPAPQIEAKSSLVKWSCGCKNVWVARATVIDFECMACRRKLVRAAP